ncbi:MAG: type II 3-dehydroquinate dehydratase [Brumimicrobium sp.]|nr:type II 3-dehydroquinate dehydratase [Brumimicrobium sp.]
MKILIINGPNLNLLGKRETHLYGEMSFEDYFEQLRKKYADLEYFQSNIEGEIIEKLQKNNADAAVLNAGGYTHTSVSIRDAVSAIKKPVIEVHITNISSREPFRHESLISPVAQGCIFGFGLKGYDLALDYLINYHS